MKKIILFIGIVSLSVACNDDNLVNRNVDTKNPTEVPPATLLSAAEKSLVDQVTSTNVNANVYRLFAQHWTETTYLDESRYDVLQRNVPDNTWREFYRDVLTDLKQAAIFTSQEIPVTDKDIKARDNRLAILEVLTVYSYTILVDTFGDVPYTQALQPKVYPTPAYDDAVTVYKDLFARLDAAIAIMDPSAASFPAVNEFVYGGNVENWMKFANSLKLRMAITVADNSALSATAKTAAEEAVTAGVFESNDDNGAVQYYALQPNTNPLYEDLFSRNDFIAAAPLVDKMNTLNDPRRPFYYIPIGGVFIGGAYAQSENDFFEYSSAGDPSDPDSPQTILLDPTFEGILLNYTEVAFYLAEAVERGYSVGGIAATYYNNAVSSSIIYWGGSQAMADTYLAQASVAYATAYPTWQQKIGEQAWIGHYNRGFEAWTSYRRLDFPALVAPVNAVAAAEGQVPKRLTYPVNEQTLNGANYTSAAAAIGSDKLSTKLFWDVN